MTREGSPDRSALAARGRIGALVTNSRYSGSVLTSKARSAFIARFADEARTLAEARGETLTAEEAVRRGEFLRRAHYARMAMRSARARRRNVVALVDVARKEASPVSETSGEAQEARRVSDEPSAA